MAFVPVFRAPFQPVFSKPGAALTRYTLTLQPNGAAGIDTFLRQSIPDSNFGTDANLRFATNYRALIKFDLSSIPVGASIVSGTSFLTLSVRAAATSIVSLNRILIAAVAWTELGATWNHLDGVSNWPGGHTGCGTSGVDYSSTALGSITATLNDPVGTIYTSALTLSEVALMVTNNAGLVFGGSSATLNYFASSDHLTAAYRPKLVVVYDA